MSFDTVLAMDPHALAEFATRAFDPGRHAAMLAFTGGDQKASYDLEETSAVVCLFGPMVMDNFEAWWVGGTNVFQTAQAIQAADADPSVTDITLVVDSPGGYHSAAIMLGDVCLAASKPINVVIKLSCFSAAYYVAACCKSIEAAGRYPKAGSIGTLIAFYDVTDYLTRIGFKLELVASSELKGLGWPGAPLTDKQRAYLKSQVDEAYADFTSTVKKGRKLSDAELKAVADARIFSAPQALSLKLIDSISNALPADDCGEDSEGGGQPDSPTDKVGAPTDPTGQAGNSTATTAATRQEVPMDVQTLKKEHAAVAAELVTEGATAERERITAIYKLRSSATSEEDTQLLETAMADPKQTAGSVAVALLDGQEKRLAAIKAARQADASDMPKVDTKTNGKDNGEPSAEDLGKQMGEAFNKRRESA